ncbi:MAG: GIY-YIG nuclease family protein [Bacteroidota bacterium]
MAYCYILYSETADKFYIGVTSETPDIRLGKHLNDYYQKSKFTNIANDWKIFWSLECPTLFVAKKIEIHLKKMKSRKYLENLKCYAEIGQKLLQKYSS